MPWSAWCGVAGRLLGALADGMKTRNSFHDTVPNGGTHNGSSRASVSGLQLALAADVRAMRNRHAVDRTGAGAESGVAHGTPKPPNGRAAMSRYGVFNNQPQLAQLAPGTGS